MEKHNSIKLIEIPKNTNLNRITKPEEIKVKPTLQGIEDLKGRELEKYVFGIVLKSLQEIDYAFLGNEIDLNDIKGSLIRMKSQDEYFKILKVPKPYVPDEDATMVIIMEYLNLTLEDLDLGFKYDQNINYFFNGKYWQVSSQAAFIDFLGKVALKTGMPETKAKQPKFREKLLAQFQTTFLCVDDQDDMGAIKINLKNGTFSFNSGDVGKTEVGILKEASKNDFFKYQLPFIYDPKATAPTFEKFLNRVLPDKYAQYILMEYLGYIFSPLKLEKTIILYGQGSNGKSVFFEVVRALFGDSNMSYMPMDDLTDDKGYHRAKLNTKLLNYASELGSLKDIEMFKRLISGEPVIARLPYGAPFEMTRYCKFMFNANTLPRVEQTEAFFRRQLIIPFTQVISESEKDIDLPNKIISTELSGIFNMILKGLERLTKQNGFSKSKLVDDQLSIYKTESNNVQLFLDDEKYVKSSVKNKLLQTIYSEYRSYCTDSGFKSLNKTHFSERLRKLTFEVKRGTQGYYYVWCEQKNNETVIHPNDHKLITDILNIKP
ncbi:MAG: DNA primase [Flavobacterium sp.]|nr:MAG: DNA primase [Flavobacterium sp.]